MSNKTIINGKELKIFNHSSSDNNTIIKTNKDNLIVNDNLIVKANEVDIIKNTNITGNLDLVGNADITGNLDIVGNVDITGNITATGGLDANHYITNAYISSSDWVITAGDYNQYFSTSNNLIVENGASFWNTNEYIIQQEGHYQACIWLSVYTAHYTNDFTVILEEWEDGALSRAYRGAWNQNAYGRNSTIITRELTAGTKLKIRVYVSGASNITLKGITSNELHTYFNIHKL